MRGRREIPADPYCIGLVRKPFACPSSALPLALCFALSPALAEAPLAVPGAVPSLVLGQLDATATEGFRLAVRDCWNVGALDASARGAVVEVALDLFPDGRPVADTIRLAAPENPDQAHAQAFEAARRAILRCAGEGYPLPPGDYALWRTMILTFDARMLR